MFQKKIKSKDVDDSTRIHQWNVIMLWFKILKVGRFIHIENKGHWIEKLTISDSNERTTEIYEEKITRPAQCAVELSVNQYLEFNLTKRKNNIWQKRINTFEYLTITPRPVSF